MLSRKERRGSRVSRPCAEIVHETQCSRPGEEVAELAQMSWLVALLVFLVSVWGVLLIAMFERPAARAAKIDELSNRAERE